jgi:aerobic-type carbon monoxide dehydrogenase small subunit (CoxS/CutS family)
MADTISINVNGKPATVTASGQERTLLEALREDLQLTGTKYGCGEGACGACTVLVNGKRTFSCSTPLAECAGKSIRTIEGVARVGNGGEALHPVQQAFLDEGAFQCGYCTAGMIMATIALLDHKADPSDGEIVDWMNTNLCRCCSYTKYLAAIKHAAASHNGTAAAKEVSKS